MIVCADDYGLREDIDQAILQLCSLDKLSAVSCMVALKRCDSKTLRPLLEHESKVDIGLHLCLTDEGLPLAISMPQPKLPAFKQLLLRAVSNGINSADIQRLIASQYELFVAQCGRPPDHIDGHLHAHQLPHVRTVLIDFVAGRPPEHRPYIRNTRMPARVLRRQKLPWMKAMAIGAFGRQMQNLLQESGLLTNCGFAGIYDFKNWRRYQEYLPRFAECLTDKNGMMVVHPGFDEDWRRQEFECLREFALLEKRLNRLKRETADKR